MSRMEYEVNTLLCSVWKETKTENERRKIKYMSSSCAICFGMTVQFDRFSFQSLANSPPGNECNHLFIFSTETISATFHLCSVKFNWTEVADLIQSIFQSEFSPKMGIHICLIHFRECRTKTGYKFSNWTLDLDFTSP